MYDTTPKKIVVTELYVKVVSFKLQILFQSKQFHFEQLFMKVVILKAKDFT